MSNEKKSKKQPTATVVLDKLVFSCTSTAEDNFDYAVTHDPEYCHSDFTFGNTQLERTIDPSNRYRHSYKVRYKKQLIGVIDFALYNNGIYTNMLRFSVNNEVFYNDTLKHIPTVLDNLNLQINNFKSIDIAIDSYVSNVEANVRRYMLNKNNTVKLLGKIIKDRNKLLKERTFYNSGSLNNPYLLRSILIKGKDGRKELVFYDKKEEIDKISQKSNIIKFHQLRKPKLKNIFRAEGRYGYEEINRYSKKIKRPISFEDLLDPQFLCDMFFEYLDRIITIYEGTGRNKTKIQLIDRPQNSQRQCILQPTLSSPTLNEKIANAYNVNNNIFKYVYNKESDTSKIIYDKTIYSLEDINYEIFRYKNDNLGRIMNIYIQHRYENNKKIKYGA